MQAKLRWAIATIFPALLTVSASKSATGPPAWAYGIAEGPAAPARSQPTAAPDNSLQHLPGNDLAFTHAQIANIFGPADWYPGDHPAMPDVVAHGRKPNVWACSLCHYPNGKGRPENAGVSGLPVAYFIEQMNEFRNGERQSGDSRKKNTGVMISIAKAMTDDEIKASATYFGSMKWTPWIKVVETETVPKTYTSVGMFLPLEGNEKEPLGQRIIETPEQPVATEELRDPRSGFIAYAPVGSIEKGKELVITGAGKTIQCGACHGADLKGLGPVPGIAGRSPSYLVRQMYDMQQGSRHGAWTELMKGVVSPLNEDDMLNIAAYTSSRMP
jgi:cytochrome c553